jgi:hypothetical protein
MLAAIDRPFTVRRMNSTSYTRGRSFEYERVHFHRANGAFLAVRSAGSRGPWDVFALYPNRVLLEQCKRVPDLEPQMDFRSEREYLAGFRVPAGVEASLVVRDDRGTTRSFRVHPPIARPIGSNTETVSTPTTRPVLARPQRPTNPSATAEDSPHSADRAVTAVLP